WKRLLERSRNNNDRLFFVDYAAEVVTKPNAETSVFPGNRNLTRTGLAMNDVIALADEDRHTRILAFTDGYSTEPLTGVPEKLEELGIPLDYRLLRGEEEADFRVTKFELPARKQIGEPFVINIGVAGTVDAEVPVTILRGGKVLMETTTIVQAGVANLRFTDRIVNPGGHEYEVRIAPQIDAHPGNNTFTNWIDIVSGPRVVLVSKYLNDPIAEVLKGQGFEVQLVSDTLSLHEGYLSGAKAVILNNVPAYEIPNEFLDAMDFFVTEQGGGFLMVGGKHSFGAGGYFESAVDPLLPVTMELKSEHRKLAVAMAIVLDRSGSMGMTVSSGHTKMQLANEGSARAVELLGGMDAVTVFAVDSQPHMIAPLLNVGEHRGELVGRIRTIESMGGGIFVYTGLQAAWDVLKKTDVGQRHVILFTDAADSEEPGDYKNLLAEMIKENCTVSVIGLGTRTDPDAKFIEDVAKRGNGRMFFTNVPGNIPNIFAQETVTVARSTFIEDPIGAQPTGGWYEIASQNVDWLKEVDGYNLSYIREDDSQALISTDEYKAPLISFGRRGIGRTGAVSFPMGGDFSQRVRDWGGFGDFLQTKTRWLMGEDAPPGVGIRHELAGTELTIDLLYDDEEWNDRFATRPPQVALSRASNADNVEKLTWDRLAPGHYSVKTDLQEGDLIRGAVQIGDVALPFGPVVVGTSTEWAFDETRVADLRSAAEASGGGEILELSDAWRKPEVKAYAGFLPWLIFLLLGLVLTDALITRTGWQFPEFSSLLQKASAFKPAKKGDDPRSEKAVAERQQAAELAAEEKAKTTPSARPTAPPEPESAPEPAKQKEEKPDPAQAAADRRSRFARAKKRK
ncbi:MAG: VWA domain-containing protein, partial [Verrucomicrobiales bacterium]|nr:VWA domain-containing protein [Verrucomicrobiales bacterium]